MAKRRDKSLEKWEVSVVKAMLARKLVPQDIHAYFTRPTRSINQARISQIRDGKLHKTIKPATEEELDAFLTDWPEVDPHTGLHLRGDELLVKAREAMIAAVQTFNGGGLFFRSELYIVTAVIAWTYLLHAYYKREGVDYRYRQRRVVKTTPSGAEKYWELGQCISFDRCPLEQGVVNNLKFLLEIRHEIEHRSTNRIDDALGAKLQACCINFNEAIKKLFGQQFGLEKQLPLALQFVTFDGSQRELLKGVDLPAHVATAMSNFQNALSDEEQQDPKFRYRVAFIPKISGNPKSADLAIEFVKLGSAEALDVERVLLQETEKPKFTASQIVSRVRADHPNFNMHDHTLLARQLDARDPKKGYGVSVAKSWFWYEPWFSKIIEKLNEGWTRP
jgi:hypothetical protein